MEGLGSINLNSAKDKAKSLRQVKTSLSWYNFVLNFKSIVSQWQVGTWIWGSS